MKNLIGYVCFGEVNTPIERLQMKHDEALAALQAKFENVIDGGLVIDDPAYETADAAYSKLADLDLDCLIVCVAGWIPTHAVIRVTDHFRHIPMLLWGLCGWKENGRIITTAEQAGTTAIRPAFEALEYTFKYVYNVIGKPWPMDKIEAFISEGEEQELRKANRLLAQMKTEDLIKGYEQLGAYDETVEIIAEQIKVQGFKVKDEHVDINIETGEPFTREQIIEIVKRIKACKYASEAEADRDIMLLEKGVLDPNISDYIFWDELTPEEIADKALSYKPIQL